MCFWLPCNCLGDMKSQCITSVAFLLTLNQFNYRRIKAYEYIINIYEINPFRENVPFFYPPENIGKPLAL